VIKEVSAQELKEIIKKGDLILVDCFTVWCHPCKRFHKILEELDQKSNGQVTIISMDMDKNKEFAKEHEIRDIPTIMFYHNGGLVGFTIKGELIDRFTGVKKLVFLEELITTILAQTN